MDLHILRSFKKSKKCCSNFTLLEVLISLTLIAIVLHFLFGFFWHISAAKSKNKTLKEKVFNIESCYLRLHSLLLHVQDDKEYLLKTYAHPDAVGSALLIYCDEETVDPAPAFCGPLYSMLYVNREHQLCLCRWSNEESAAKVEILLRGVVSASYAFFVDNAWTNNWPKTNTKEQEDSSSVLMIKISLTLEGSKNKSQDFIFSLTEGEIAL